MKTAISVPDRVFKSAEKLADRLGKSRSQLYTQALNSYLEIHKADNITQKLDEVYNNQDSSLDKKLSKIQSKSIVKDMW